MGQVAYRDSLRKVFKAEQNPDKKSHLLLNICANYATNSLFDSARRVADEGIRMTEGTSFQSTYASFYYDKGVTYLMQGINGLALENVLKDLKIREKIHDSSSIASAYNMMGIIYQRMKEPDKAVAALRKGIQVAPVSERVEQFMDYFGNISSVFMDQGQYDSALVNLNKSLQLSLTHHSKKKTAISYQNIGDVLIRQKKYREALVYTKRSIALTEESGENYGTAQLYMNMGLISRGLKDNKKALGYMDKALKIEEEGKSIDELRQIYEALADIYKEEHDFSNAYNYHLLFTKFKDSIFNRENLNTLSDLKAAYEIDKREEEMKRKEQEEMLKQNAEEHRQALIYRGLSAGGAMVGVLALFLYRSYRTKKKANKVITVQRAEIELKNETLSQVHKEISDSIQYAQRIQQAILPPIETIRKSLPSSFIYFQPKDVVSGDFYFFHRLNEEEMIFAACDCTGHGVPGAFMSMIGSEQLSKIISVRKITRPGDIMNDLHNGVRKRLRQDTNDSRDGMDVALLKLNTKNGNIQFSGANRPLWIFRSQTETLEEIKPDKRPIGGLEHLSGLTFTNHEFRLVKGDRLYMFSDGFADQFGGEKSKKMMIRNFRKLLLSLMHLPMEEQEHSLRRKFAEWKGKLEQIDDVLIVGIQL